MTWDCEECSCWSKCGSIEGGTDNRGGIIHLAARDIFSRIGNDPECVFVFRVSFIEIYNEEVRDLLISSDSNNVLAIREDPQRGVFVNSNESIVTDLTTLLATLFAGEKKWAVASTGMNDRSSRSLTIFRTTIESRKKSLNTMDDDNGSDTEDSITDKASTEDDGAVRISTRTNDDNALIKFSTIAKDKKRRRLSDGMICQEKISEPFRDRSNFLKLQRYKKLH